MYLLALNILLALLWSAAFGDMSPASLVIGFGAGGKVSAAGVAVCSEDHAVSFDTASRAFTR